MRRASIYTAWARACRKVGLKDFHIHDLRHTGNTLAAATGASTKELMSRMGHANPRAALMYQHATRGRDEAIAGALSDMISGATTTIAAIRPLRQVGEAESQQQRPGGSGVGEAQGS